jgi:hypothetical protein
LITVIVADLGKTWRGQAKRVPFMRLVRALGTLMTKNCAVVESILRIALGSSIILDETAWLAGNMRTDGADMVSYWKRAHVAAM